VQPWLEYCESWLARRYNSVLGLNLSGGSVRLRWLSADALTNEVGRAEAQGVAIEDADVGWLLFLLPYEPNRLEQQVNQALGLRSRLLRESNYTGNETAGDKEDRDSTWRVGLVWLVEGDKWADWQRHILELRRESGAAEEISFDAVQVARNDVHAALDAHGLPRLLLHARALLSQSPTEAEKWLSANVQVSAELENFSQQFDTPRARAFARELEETAKSFQPAETRQPSSEARQFRRFRVKHFRNLDSLEVIADSVEDVKAKAIVLFGPNGTGKSSFAEALSLATFGTSPRLEQFLGDRDLARATTENYFNDYLSPLDQRNKSDAKPCFAWDNGEEYDDASFTLNPDEESRRRYEGVVLNQEDSIEFTKMSHEELAARVLKGYSSLADHLSGWLAQEDKRANETKLAFTRKHGLGGATKLSATAYKGLAQTLLSEELTRSSPEFLDWLRFLGRLPDEDGRYASKLVSDWTSQQDNVVSRLAETLAKLQEKGAPHLHVVKAIREKLDEFDKLAKQSGDYRQRLESRIVTLREQLDVALTQMESWGVWLASQANAAVAPVADSQVLKVEIENLGKERIELEENGKALRSRLGLLDQVKQFLTSHWAAQHPNTCPVCNSDVSDRQGIEVVVSTLQEETNAAIQTLRDRHVDIQNRQKELDAKLKATGLSTCPLAVEDQARLKSWLQPFLPEGESLEDRLLSQQSREQLKGDVSRMRIFPEAPKPYANVTLEAERLASYFIALTQEADRALEDPQATGEVKKAFEQRMEKVLKDHLPSTLEKVWLEIILTLTTASWVLPAIPTLKLEQRGKSLSVQTVEKGRYIRYIYNAAERHVLGLAWFFTYYLAKRRFEEAWMLLDDPAQEMDQPSFRELVRLWETLLRIHQRRGRPFTMIVALHQEERALDATRATNGRLYIFGWKKEQQDTSPQASVKKVVLLAPGFHPLKPEKMFS
jgi:hypothetical protein